MRYALISDSHTKDNIEVIRDYLKEKAHGWKLKAIIINGDILGEDEAREGYGYNFNKTLFQATLKKDEILKKQVPELADKLHEIRDYYEKGLTDSAKEIELAKHIRSYVQARYDYLFKILIDFSNIRKTYFNIGTHESPLHYKVLEELAFLIDVKKSFIRRLAMLSDYRECFKEFLSKVKDPKLKKLKYIGGSPTLDGDLVIAGIPGLNPSSVAQDNMSEFQEKITSDLMNSLRRQMGYGNKLLILNQTQGRLRKDPFGFRPGSMSVRKFIEEIKGKLRQKIFVQSYHHWMTTHFYKASEFHFLLNNAAVNNALFNILDISTKVHCFDVDLKKDRVRKLKLYNYNVVDYSKPEDRLKLNYEDPEEIIKERNLKGCYYM